MKKQPALLLTIWLLLVSTLAATPLPHIDGYTAIQLQRGGLNRLALPATIHGKPTTFLIDTGAALSAIDPPTAKEFRLGPPPPQSKIPQQRVINGRKTNVVWVPDFQSSPMRFGDVPMTLLPPGEHFRDFNQGQLHGLFGSDLLHRYQTVLNCGNAQIFFKTDANVPLRRTLVGLGYVAIPLQKRGGIYFVPCKLRNKFPFQMMVDTGAFVTILKGKIIDRFSLRTSQTNLRQSGINGRAERVSSVTADEHRITIGGVAIPSGIGTTEDALLNRTLSRDDDLGIVGGDVLSALGAIIDYGTDTLYLRPARAKK